MIQIKNTQARESSEVWEIASSVQGLKNFTPLKLLTHPTNIPISFQKPGLIGKLSVSKVGGKYFNAKLRTAIERKVWGDLLFISSSISFNFSCLTSQRKLPHFSLTCLRNIFLASHSLCLLPAFHYFLTAPLMLVSLFPSHPRVLIQQFSEAREKRWK